MFCAECGQPVVDKANFCGHCGAALAAQWPPTPQPSESISEPTQAATTGIGRARVAGGAAAGASFGAVAAAHALLVRVQGILLSPSTEWPLIAAEPSSAGAIYLRYVAPLVALGAIATLIGASLVGAHVAPPPDVYRVPFASGLVHAVVSFVLSLVGVFLIAHLADALAPTFGGKSDMLAALKVSAYSYTPAWVAGILNLVPALGIVAMLCAFYGVYLIYLGLPVLMRCPRQRSLGYTAVLALCAIALSIVISAANRPLVGGLGLRGPSAPGALGQAKQEERDRASESAAGSLSNLLSGESGADHEQGGDASRVPAPAGERVETERETGKAPGAPDLRPTAPGSVDANTVQNAARQMSPRGQ
jgi:Yip1-like protein/zinc ribbon protein